MSTEKSARSRLLMPRMSASTSSARSSSSSSWTSTSTSRSSAARLAVQLVELVVVEHGDDQQDRVGAGRRGLVELVAVDDEVLAQHRQLGGRDRLAQVVERAAEVRALGEDRQRRRAAALVGLDDVGHRRALADHARPTASGACARRSRRCRGARAPRRTAGPRAARSSAASSCESGVARRRRSSSSRVDSTIRSRTFKTVPIVASGRPACRAPPWRRPSRAPARRRARRPRGVSARPAT